MERFGYKDVVDNLDGHKIHRLDNIFTLDFGIRDLFNRLAIWFERTVSILLFALYRVGGARFRMRYTSTQSGQQIQYCFAWSSHL